MNDAGGRVVLVEALVKERKLADPPGEPAAIPVGKSLGECPARRVLHHLAHPCPRWRAASEVNGTSRPSLHQESAYQNETAVILHFMLT